MRLEDLALIGNCQISALIERTGVMVWCCLPRFDSEPIFGRLLDPEGGHFTVGAADGAPGVQRYLGHSNVLETRFDGDGGSFRVIDFAPRFVEHARMFRPTQLIRMVEPLSGTPRVKVECDPRLGWSRATPEALHGSHHVRYEGFGAPLRLTTDIPITYLGGQPFTLTQRRHLALTWGPPLEEPLEALCGRFLHETQAYWQRWVKHCNVPPTFQAEVIRSALVLKLHCFEDTGAIVAAMTTSIPEAAGSGRTWDYRYCWLRDAYYVLGALRRLGHFEEREAFINFLLNVAAADPALELKPLYRVDGRSDLDEHIMADWPGFGGDGPVRVGNGAVHHRQHDIYGEMVLALAPIFLDERFSDERSASTLELIERLARRAMAVVGTPDAGIWEYRTEWVPQTFSSLMCWAAADRMAMVAARHLPGRTDEFAAAARRMREEVLARAWNPARNSFTASYDGKELDAALLQMAPLRFLPGNEPRLHATVAAIMAELGQDGWLLRYRLDDGFGRPQVAFTICSFWLIEALATLGRTSEARAALERITRTLTPLGLISEDYETSSLRMWGNFPQAYSHVGLIHAAFAASPPWGEWL